jgi:hypothetical protein
MRRLITKVQGIGGAADVLLSNIVPGPCLVTFVGRDAADTCVAASTVRLFADPGNEHNTIGPVAWAIAGPVAGPVVDPANGAGRFWLGLPIGQNQSFSAQIRGTGGGAGNIVMLVEYDDLT